MTIRTDELTGLALNWAVAYALLAELPQPERGLLIHQIGYGKPIKPYSTDWAEGGPIIERESISVTKHADQSYWWASSWDSRTTATGATALTAAMRCYAASKLGDEVEVPDSLGVTP